MSRTIDERVVSMRFDNQQFESNVQTSISTLDRLKNALKLDGVSKSLENIDSSAKNLNFSTLGEAVSTVSSRFSAMEVVAITALANIANSAINAGKQLVSSLTIEPISQGFQEYELKMGAVQTIMASTGEDVQTVNKYLNELNEYADRTIYSFSDMTQNIGKFTNAGVSLDSSVKAIQGVSNVAAVAGANTQEASRAMYNFAQALSNGAIKRHDWRSIEMANMATLEFKQSLLDTALAMGTVVKEGEMYISTTTDANGKTSDAFSATKMFNDSLASNWMTTEVLIETLENYSTDLRTMTEAEKEAWREKKRATGYTEEQIKAIEKLGIKAADSAKDIKTFSQMMDTLKEAAGSGWAQTFELLFGNFEEAKTLWTGIGGEIEKVLNAMTDARNIPLEMFNKAGGRETVISGLVAGWKTFVDILKEVKEVYRSVFPERDLVEKRDEILHLAMEFRNFMITLKPTESFMTNLRNTFQGLFSIMKVGGQVISGLGRAFGALVSAAVKIAGALLGVTGDIGLVVSSFMEMVSASGAIEEAFDRVCKVIDIFADAIVKSIQIVRNTVSALANGSGITSVVQNFINFLETAVRAIVDTFSAITGINVEGAYGRIHIFFRDLKVSASGLSGVDATLRKIGGAIKDFVVSIKESFSGKMSFNLSEFTDGFKDIKLDPIQKAGSVIKGFVQGLAEVLRAAAPLITSLLGNIKDAVLDVFGKIGETITAGNGLGIANILIGGGLGLALTGFAESLHKLAGIFDGIGDMFDAAFIKSLAVSLGILAGSMLLISMIDADKLSASVAAIGALFAELVAAITMYNKLNGLDTITDKKKGIGGIASAISDASKRVINLMAIKAMAEAVLILSVALKVISTINPEALLPSVVALGAVMAELTIAMTYLTNNTKGAVKGATGMITMATAIVILSAALAKIGALPLAEIGKGLLGITVLLGELCLASLALQKTGGISVGTGLAMMEIGAAMVIFGKAIAQIGGLDLAVIGKGLLGIGGALAAVAVSTKMMPAGSDMMGTGLGLIAIAGAMNLMVKPISELGALPLPNLAKGVGAVAASMISLGVSMKLMPGGASMIAIGVGLIAVAGAINMMVGPIQSLGQMKLSELAKGIGALAASLLVLAGGLHAMNGTLGGAAALVVAAAGLNAMVGPIQALGNMSIGNIVKSLVTLAGSFALFAIAGTVAAPIAALGAALLVLGAALLAIGGGVTMLAAGLTALSASGVAAVTSLVAALEILIVGLLKVIAHSSDAFKDAFVALIRAGLSAFTETISDAVEVLLKFIKEVLKSFATHTPEIVDTLMTLIIDVINAISTRVPELVVAAMNLISSIFEGIIQGLGSVNVKNLVGGIAAIGLTAALIAAVAAITPMIPQAMVGIVGVGAVIAEMAIVLAAIGKLNQIPGLQEMAASGGDLLATLGNAIGKFVGSIIGGVGEGLTASLPKIADNLSEFATNIIPFTVGMKNIDEGIVNSTMTLAKAILTISGAQLIDGIMSFLGISTSMDEFGEKLVSFGRAVKQYGDEVAGIDAEIITASATAGEALVTLAGKIPNTGGLVSFITGDNDMGKFGEQLVKFGEAMTKYNDAISGVDANVITASANAGEALVDMAAKIPNTGGLVSFITGDNDMGKFGEQLVLFGEGMSKYNESVAGVKADVVQQSVTAGQALLELASSVPNTGGLVSFITGDNDMGKFGEQLVLFGEAMSKYCVAIEGVTPEAITESVAAGQMLVELANTIPNTGGLFAFFSGSNDMGKFGEQLSQFGTSLRQYCNNINGISAEQVGGVVDGLMRLIDFAKAAAGLDTSGMSGFGQAMANMARNGISEFVNAFGNSADQAISAANTLISNVTSALSSGGGQLQSAGQQAAQMLIQGLSQAITSGSGEVTNTATQICTTLVNTIKTNLPSATFRGIGQTNVMQSLITGMTSKRGAATAMATNISNDIINAFRRRLTSTELNNIGQSAVQGIINGMSSKQSQATEMANTISKAIVEAFKNNLTQEAFIQIGEHAAMGLAIGIQNKIKEIADAAIKAAQEAVNSARNALKVSSPSKVFIKIGEYASLGLAKGLLNLLGTVGSAGSEVANTAVDSVQYAMERALDLLEDTGSLNPTIRPVLDLSEIQNGAGRINSLLPSGLNVSSAYGRVTSLSNMSGTSLFGDESINGDPATVVNNFNQYNYSPKALSRKDIYRQTQNLFSAQKGAVARG